ncbi:MAG: hypothetical protein HQL30_07680, partial [Candidatus Omnitrophica bacterium]|nr:hypothetical protein [Candidatus Omnitrophota bacterium]
MKIKKPYLEKIVSILLTLFIGIGNCSYADAVGGIAPGGKTTLSPELMFGNMSREEVLYAKLVCEAIEKRFKRGENLEALGDWVIQNPNLEGFDKVSYYLLADEVHIVIGDKLLVRYFPKKSGGMGFLFSGDKDKKSLISDNAVTGEIEKELY